MGVDSQPWDYQLYSCLYLSHQPARSVEWPAEGPAEAPVQEEPSVQMEHRYSESSVCSEAETFRDNQPVHSCLLSVGRSSTVNCFLSFYHVLSYMCASHGQLGVDCPVSSVWNFFFCYIDEIRSMHAQLWSAPTTSLKAWMDVVSLCSSSYCVLLLCLPRFSHSAQRAGVSVASSVVASSAASTFRGKQQEDREKKVNGFDPTSWDQSSMDCKAGFPSQGCELLLLPQGDCWWLRHK